MSSYIAERQGQEQVFSDPSFSAKKQIDDIDSNLDKGFFKVYKILLFVLMGFSIFGFVNDFFRYSFDPVVIGLAELDEVFCLGLAYMGYQALKEKSLKKINISLYLNIAAVVESILVSVYCQIVASQNYNMSQDAKASGNRKDADLFNTKYEEQIWGRNEFLIIAAVIFIGWTIPTIIVQRKLKERDLLHQRLLP